MISKNYSLQDSPKRVAVMPRSMISISIWTVVPPDGAIRDIIAEPDEILTISIARAITSASIPVEFVVQQLNVTIIDNDSEWVSE